MVAWYWIPIVAIIAACFGYIICGFFVVDEDKSKPRKWWEDT